MKSNQIKLLIDQLGPLAYLAGTWEGTKGDDIAPSDSRGTENNKYTERMTFEIMGSVKNHEQCLNVLRYSTKATRLGEKDPFHEELGYWSWESQTKELLRCFIIPRGIALIAGGIVEKTALDFNLQAQCGSTTHGICVNPFLEKEFKITSYKLNLIIHDENKFSYRQHTYLQMPGRNEIFDHSDTNTLTRVSYGIN